MRFVFALALVPALAAAQSGPSCHKGHARDYKMSEMPAPHKIEGIGNSHLTITTKFPQAQVWFDQGGRRLMSQVVLEGQEAKLATPSTIPMIA